MKNVYMIDTTEIVSRAESRRITERTKWTVLLFVSALLFAGIVVGLFYLLFNEGNRELSVIENERADVATRLENAGWKHSLQKVGTSNWRTISFADKNYGWVGGLKAQVDSSYEVSSVTNSELYATDNGGQTWQPVTLDVPQESYISFVKRISKSDGVVVIQKPRLRAQQRGLQILFTRDGGSSWVLVFEAADFRATKFLLDGHGIGWVVGERGVDRAASPVAAWTLDSGLTWSIFSKGKEPWTSRGIQGPNHVADGVISPTGHTLFLLSDNRIMELERSGNTWTMRRVDPIPINGQASIIGFDGGSPVVMNAIRARGYVETLVHPEALSGGETITLPNIFLHSSVQNRGDIIACGFRYSNILETTDNQSYYVTRLEGDAVIMISPDSGRTWGNIAVLPGYVRRITDRGARTDLDVDTTCNGHCEEAFNVSLNDIAWNGETYFVCGNNGVLMALNPPVEK